MINIDDYINASASMPNTSDGGSAAYHFEDVVLIKYQTKLGYDVLPRKNEEVIASVANEKIKKGVRTPAHLGLKREIEGDTAICWVLQERAKGVNFNNYCYIEDAKKQLAMQKILANAPSSHYEKLVADVIVLFNFGLELKSKNIFYDEDILNGGFTIIDLPQLTDKTFDFNSLKDVFLLNNMLSFIYSNNSVLYSKNATDAEKEESRVLQYRIIQKVFMAMEKVIPNFGQHRRWLLRTMPDDVLAFFNNNGNDTSNLTLNEQECKYFGEMVQQVINDCLKGLVSGEYKAWDVIVNQIKSKLGNLGLFYNFRYHKDKDSY